MIFLFFRNAFVNAVSTYVTQFLYDIPFYSNKQYDISRISYISLRCNLPAMRFIDSPSPMLINEVERHIPELLQSSTWEGHVFVWHL